jgi:hypothetical protein
MTESVASMNPVDGAGSPMTSPGAPLPAANTGLFQKLRETALQGCQALFHAAMESTDDVLFSFSEKSETTAERGQFMDAMRNLRVVRPAMEQTFREALADRFMAFQRNAARGSRPDTAGVTLDSDTLALVEEHALEEDLALDGMSAKAVVRHHGGLFALQQRLAVVMGVREVDPTALPFGPEAICEALRAVMRHVEADITVKLVIFKIFDRQLVVELDQVYDVTNRLLAEAGILPSIKYVRPPRASSESATPRVAEAAAEPVADGGTAGAPPEPTDPETAEMISALASLLALRRQSGGAPRPHVPGPRIDRNELIAALSQMQAQGLTAPDPALDALSPVERVERVKQDLIEQLRRSGIESAEHRVETSDEDAIDLVGMLFQFVVQDRNLPAEIQAVLSRLQIPYVRVAIKDRHLFAQRAHPARKLLDTLALSSVAWSREADRDGRYLKTLTQVVDRVIAEYADDFGLFETVDAEFQAFLEKQRRQSEVAEQRANDAALGREKLAQARRAASDVVNRRLERRELPPLAREVILNPWTNYLVLTHLRHGPESNEWKSAVSFVDAVIWASLPKTAEQDFARLATLLPQMQALLRHGLGMVGFGEQDMTRLSQGFGALFDSLHKREVGLDEAASIAAAERSLDHVPPAPGASEEEDEPLPLVPDDDEYVQKVRALKVGTWIEFSAVGADPERAKVSWISPLSARLLFVNRKGLKVAERSVFTLADELRNGSAQILEVAPIFERALNSIMSRLKYEHLLAGGGQSAPG